jgi:hypothetical protein
MQPRGQLFSQRPGAAQILEPVPHAGAAVAPPGGPTQNWEPDVGGGGASTIITLADEAFTPDSNGYVTLIVGVGKDTSQHVPSWLTSGATGVRKGVAPVTVENANGAWSYSLVQDSYGYNVLDLSQFVGLLSGTNAFIPCPDVTQPCSDLQLLIRETLPNPSATAQPSPFTCSVQAVPFYATQYTNADGKGAGLMGPYLPRVDYQSLARASLPRPPVLQSDLPDPGFCGVLPSAPMLNAPSSGNPANWPTYWSALTCGTSSPPQAAPSFVASLVATEDWSNNDTLCGSTGACNFVNYLTPQNDAFPTATPPPVPITIVGTGFGYLSTTAAGPPQS